MKVRPRPVPRACAVAGKGGGDSRPNAVDRRARHTCSRRRYRACGFLAPVPGIHGPADADERADFQRPRHHAHRLSAAGHEVGGPRASARSTMWRSDRRCRLEPLPARNGQDPRPPDGRALSGLAARARGQGATTNVSAIWPPLGDPSAPVGKRLATSRIPAPPRPRLRTRQRRRLRLGRDGIRDVRDSGDHAARSRGPASGELAGLERARPRAQAVPQRRGLDALFPVSTLIIGVGLNVTFMSYGKHVIMGFTANGAALPEAGRLAQYAPQGILRRYSGSATRPAAPVADSPAAPATPARSAPDSSR